ncbi:DUF6585 family protein [Streptomyces sp. G-G2]|uniref:DUF6585 family protein n=1 Tax=Streptomyces sp. G-G2 TaxID=3046201 RepID=UPI0024BB7EEA|nr:DUF6585 family protein [Streptomyces sp. G-G2]MDJ0382592.1 hypothetical protein [Streptomyces sp. G-G2]
MDQTGSVQDQVDRELRETAVREGLGARRASYPSAAPAHSGRARAAGGLAVLTSIAMVAAVSSSYPALALALAPVLLICLASLLGHAFGSGRNTASRLELYEKGLLVLQRGRIRAVRYADTTVLDNVVRRTQYGRTLSVTYSFGLTDTAGRDLTVGSLFAGGELWGPRLRQDVTAAQLPGALDRPRAGERLDFGPFWLTAREVGSGRTSAPWPQIEAVDATDGSIKVLATGRRGPLAVGYLRLTPDAFLFLALAQRLRTAAGS